MRFVTGGLASAYYLLGVAITLALAGSAAAEEDYQPYERSANFMMNGCRAKLQNHGYGDYECFGVVAGIVYLESMHEMGDEKSALFCTPKNATPEQVLRVVVTYIDANPQYMHERFESLAITALIAAWPCNHPFPLRNHPR